MATFLAKIKIKEGKEADFEEVCRQLHAETMKEEGCRQYNYWRTQEDRTYLCLLAFDSYRDFILHQTSDYHEQLIVPRGAEFFEDFSIEWLDPVQGAGDGPPTAHQAVSPDANELEKRYTETMPAIVAEWWQRLRPSA